VRWNLAEWLYSVQMLPKIDNARPFGNRGSNPECRHGRGNEEWKRVGGNGVCGWIGGRDVEVEQSGGADE
jgi:hypothetical protein